MNLSALWDVEHRGPLCYRCAIICSNSCHQLVLGSESSIFSSHLGFRNESKQNYSLPLFLVLDKNKGLKPKRTLLAGDGGGGGKSYQSRLFGETFLSELLQWQYSEGQANSKQKKALNHSDNANILCLRLSLLFPRWRSWPRDFHLIFFIWNKQMLVSFIQDYMETASCLECKWFLVYSSKQQITEQQKP